eukprot:5702502-Amphidinium_carterae.1
MPEETRKQYVTVTGEGLTIKSWQEVTLLIIGLIIGAITMKICLIVAKLQSPLLGLPDIDDDNVTVHTGNNPNIERRDYTSPMGYNPSLPTIVNLDCWRHRGSRSTSQYPQTTLTATTTIQTRTRFTSHDTHAIQILVSNMLQGQRTTRTSSTRRTQRTICDTVGLCLHSL